MFYGDKEDWFKDMAEGGKIPLPLQNKPILKPELIPMIEAFWELRGTAGMGQMGIPESIKYSEMAAYHAAFNPFPRQFFFRAIRGMDISYQKTKRPK